MKTSLRIVLGLTLLLLGAGTGASRAGIVLDQQLDPANYPPNTQISSGFGGTQNLAQTFTVGITGTLAQVGVSLERFNFNPPTGTLFLQIRSTIGGVPAPDPSYLLQVSVPEAALPLAPNFGFVQFDVSAANLQVTQGEQLAIVLLAPDLTNPVSWIGTLGDNYTAGNAFVEQPPDIGFTPAPTPDSDLGFQTFVLPVPEPSTLVMSSLACLTGLAYASRRRLARRRS